MRSHRLAIESDTQIIRLISRLTKQTTQLIQYKFSFYCCSTEAYQTLLKIGCHFVHSSLLWNASRVLEAEIAGTGGLFEYHGFKEDCQPDQKQ